MHKSLLKPSIRSEQVIKAFNQEVARNGWFGAGLQTAYNLNVSRQYIN